MQVAEAVGRALVQRGVRHVFGLIGSGNFAVSNALVAAGATFVASRHEGGAITMADAYARVSGRVGVCSVHQGPGLTNLMTGLTEAAKSRTPLVVLAADTAAAAIRSNFRIDQDGLVTAVGAVPERLHSPESAVADALRAYRRAQVERRPVVLMMPLDVQAAFCSWDGEALPPSPLLRPARPAAASILAAADALAHAARPLIVAGRGAVLADARAPLERLGDLVGALFATSANGNGLFAGSPWSLGISGGFASPVAAGLIAEADVVVSVGAGLNMWTTRHGRLLHPTATVVQVDHEADAIGAHHRVDVAVVGDAAEAVRCLIEEIERRGMPPSRWRSPELAERIRRGSWQAQPLPVESEGRRERNRAGTAQADDAHQGQVRHDVARYDEAYYDQAYYAPDDDEEAPQASAGPATSDDANARIDPRVLTAALDALLPDERTVAIDSGHFMGYPAMYLRVPDAAGFVFTQAYQAVGLGLASAIGAAVARPDRLTVAALGDGGALMSLPEFETVARLGLRMLIVIYNDAAYGAEVHHFGPHGHPLDLVRFPDVDIAALGRAAGLEGATVRSRGDLTVVADWLAGGSTRALVLDVKVIPTVVAEWLEEAFRGH